MISDPTLSPAGEQALREIAEKHGLSIVQLTVVMADHMATFVATAAGDALREATLRERKRCAEIARKHKDHVGGCGKDIAAAIEKRSQP